MQGSVFVEAWVRPTTGQPFDISHKITYFKHSLSVPEQDTLEMTLDFYDWVDKGDEMSYIKGGVLIEYRYGYTGGLSSPYYKGRVTFVNPKFTNSDCNISLVLSPLGAILNMSSSRTVFKNMTTSEIVTAIAKEYNLQTDIDITTYKHSSIAQGRKTFWQFLKYLALIENDYYNVYLTSGVLHFKRRGTYKKALYFFDLQSVYSNVEELSFTWEVITKKDGFGINSYIDPKTGEFKTEEALDDVKLVLDKDNLLNEWGEAITNPASLFGKKSFDEFAGSGVAETAANVVGGVNKFVGTMTSKVSKTFTNSNLGKKLSGEKKINELTAAMTTTGCPLYLKDTVITIRGVPSEYVGNYWVQSMTHTIDDSGYKTTFDLNRNGLRYPDAKEDSFLDKLGDTFDKLGGESNEDEGTKDAGNNNLNEWGETIDDGVGYVPNQHIQSIDFNPTDLFDNSENLT
jgi:phage protein D